ncbi:sulfopropanediol 3-dehydrogenase [Kushneria sinocarnis]|uniref:Sulfopropanediol 3-dehydrogenase n=1 Tax=Kushneria sinocarnis TaxID=595502 RepID=A0A420X0R8_9GAMM|nr:histidinol dehydrogenase [Kushneria sinocarnis]RKR07402.1 sulfopropanediol 3-dehydrogenase [Kushneria sinocarnis]
MATEYIKASNRQAQQQASDRSTREKVQQLISAVEEEGEPAIRRYSEQFDRWNPDAFRLSDEQIRRCIDSLDAQIIEDIRFAQQQIRHFARAQRECLQDLEIETLPGVTLGHRNVPVASAGCYVPGGRYPIVASAHMSVVTAKEAGVERVIACTPPVDGEPNAAIVASLALGGADEIYLLGGVQALAAMALGTSEITPVDMIVGPGNAFVSEAKRQLYGRVGIDLLAGPTEILVLADDSADAEMVATDLLGQAEHGPGSPATLVTTCRQLAEATLGEIERQLQTLATAEVAGRAWADHGEIRLVDDEQTMIKEANAIAAEHVEVLTREPRRHLATLKNYGSAFIGPETNVAYGDKVIGTNHILPTLGAARYTGGLWVGKFIRTLTWQQCTPEASVEMGRYCSRLCALERFWGHKAQADLRLARYTRV